MMSLSICSYNCCIYVLITSAKRTVQSIYIIFSIMSKDVYAYVTRARAHKRSVLDVYLHMQHYACNICVLYTYIYIYIYIVVDQKR
jgi:hypothetical protein